MKKIITILCTMIFVMMLGVVSFAESGTTYKDNSFSTETVNGSTVYTSSANATTTATNVSSSSSTTGIPTVTISQAQNWASSKGNDIVKFLQTAAQPISISIFIICAILALIGALGNGRLVGTGIWGMVISVIVYAFIIYSKDFLTFIISWLHP